MNELSRAEYIRRVADEIHDTRDIKEIVADVGLPPGDIDWNGASRLVWSEVLTHAQRVRKLDELRERIGGRVVALRGVTIAPPRVLGGPPAPGDSWSPHWDVGREEIEKAALRMIEGSERTPVVVHGPRGYGKSWFLKRLFTRLDESDGRVFLLMIPEAVFKTDAGAEEFFRTLVRYLADKTNMKPSEFTALWRQDPDLNPSERFHYFVKSLPGSPRRRTCLLFDVPDRIWKLEPGVRNDFFGKIREWMHADDGPLTELRSVVAFSLTPALMHDDPNQSNLNPTPFVLGGLNHHEVRSLAALYGLDWTSAELVEVQRVLDGHPKYVRTLMSSCVGGQSVIAVLATCHLPERIFHNDLLDLREMLRSRDSLWRAFQRVATSHAAPERNEDHRALLSAGLIRSEDGVRFDLRYGLLHRILDLPA